MPPRDGAPVKALIKRLLRWDARSRLEKSVLLHRALHFVATLICLLPIPAGRLLGFFGSDKERPTLHRYGEIYQRLFRPLKYRRIRLLEIGIGGDADDIGGRSLLAWQALFACATIVAIDIQDRQALATRRTRIRRLDQAAPGDLAALCREGPFDVIIDDGSHLSQHQLASFHGLFDALRDGGFYIIEDVHTSYWPAIVGGVRWDGAEADDPAFAATCMGYFLELAKHLNAAEFLLPPDPARPVTRLAGRVRRVSFEHNLIVIEKGRNDGPSIRRLLDSEP
jgi:hypothetical protein